MSPSYMNRTTDLRDLRKKRYDFLRCRDLRREFEACVVHHLDGQAMKADEGLNFEARGLLVTGESRLGKTTEVRSLVDEFNNSGVTLEDGRPAKIVSCTLRGTVTWKNLGAKTLDALGYPCSDNRTSSQYWSKVLHQMRAQGVMGIYYDEVQHVFKRPARGASQTAAINDQNKIIRDSFKALMKEAEWPVMLIFSGVPELSDHILPFEELRELLNPVHFEPIDLDVVRSYFVETEDGIKEIERSDRDELLSLLYGYSDFSGVDITPLLKHSFLDRLVFACGYRWGLVIELIIEVLASGMKRTSKTISIDDFVYQYSRKSRVPLEFSPFTHPNYRKAYNPIKLLEDIDANEKIIKTKRYKR